MNISRIGDIVLTIAGAIFMIVGFATNEFMLVAVGIVWAIILPDWDE